MNKINFPAFLLLAFTLLSACAPAPQPSEQLIPPIERQAPLPTAAPLEPALEPNDPANGSSFPTGFPSAAFAAREALAEQLSISAETIEIRKVEPAEWPDGCLGLAGPGEMCTMAIVPGYRITLAAGETEYVYRTDERGTSLRREMDTPLTVFFGPAQPLAAWHNPECTESAALTPEGISFGACGRSSITSPWPEGGLPAVLLHFLETFAPFEAETPIGKLTFNGSGTQIAAPAEQRAIAEWLKIQFLAAQSGRAEADWGLALTYRRQGGFAGFCDEMKIYLDGSVLLSSCKDVDVDYRLDVEQLEQFYAWYDNLQAIEYDYTDAAVTDALSIAFTMLAQGDNVVDQTVIDEILAFCAGLIQQARAEQ